MDMERVRGKIREKTRENKGEKKRKKKRERVRDKGRKRWRREELASRQAMDMRSVPYKYSPSPKTVPPLCSGAPCTVLPPPGSQSPA